MSVKKAYAFGSATDSDGLEGGLFIHSFIYLHVKNPLHVPRTGYRQLSSTKHEHIKYNAC
jgi:hypothetical protein